MKKILIIDDDPDILDVIRIHLENAGYETVSASDGREGLTRAIDDAPDLIITDVVMPKMDGFELFKSLKENKRTAVIPVLVLTARGTMEKTFTSMGADGFLVKPFEDYELLSKVSVLLSRPSVLEPPALGRKVLSNKKVLVAGASRDVVDAMVKLLKERRCLTVTALSGAESVSQCVEFLPEVIVLDIQIDGVSSSEDIVKTLRLLPGVAHVPILLYSYYDITELGSEEMLQKATAVDVCQKNCLQAGATEYLGPFNENTFVDQVGAYG